MRKLQANVRPRKMCYWSNVEWEKQKEMQVKGAAEWTGEQIYFYHSNISGGFFAVVK